MEKKNPLRITETILRDAHQSQAATRMRIEDMLPACELLDNMGYWSLECWGGATFDVCMRFLNEDPWERLRTLKAHMPKTKLQMLFRGQNILGYKHYAGQSVKKGDVLVILEAMKMENEICAPSDGKITGVNVRKGDSVETQALLCTIA